MGIYKTKLSLVEKEMTDAIAEGVNRIGKESEFSGYKVISINDGNFMYNLNGSRFLSEISEKVLIDNYGYEYVYSVLDLKQLADLADYIKSL